MKNFEFEHNGEKLWYSRSLACNLLVFIKKSDGVYILANKRGQGCEFNKGLWNVPGGFIDFDEDSKDCAIRETWEETNIRVPRDKVNFLKLDTYPHGKRQTMIAVHYAIFNEDEIEDWKFSTEHCEQNEVEQIELIHLDDLSYVSWTNNQLQLIRDSYNNLVNNNEI